MAIAFDAAVDGSLVNPGTSLTWAHTTTGSDRILFVGVFGDNKAGDATGNKITGVTYNGVALTEIGRILEENGDQTSDRWVYLWALGNPASGANNVVVSASASIVIAGQSVSYTGASSTGIPDASQTNHVVAPNTTFGVTLTPVASNCWGVKVSKNTFGTPSAGASTTARVTNSNGMGMFDSNGTISGATTLTTTTVSNAGFGGVMASFKPPGAGGGSVRKSTSLGLMGVQ